MSQYPPDAAGCTAQLAPPMPSQERRFKLRGVDPAVAHRVADALKGYRDIAALPADEVLKAAYSIVYEHAKARFDARFAGKQQLAQLAALIAPLRTFLERPGALNREAQYDLHESGFLVSDQRDLADLVEILKLGEIEAPPQRGRARECREDSIAISVAVAIERLTRSWPGTVARGQPKTGRFANVLRQVFDIMDCGRASTETAIRHVNKWRKQQQALPAETR